MNSENVKFAKSLGFEEDKIKQVLAKQYENYDRSFITFYDFAQALMDFSDVIPESKSRKYLTVADARKILQEEGRCQTCFREDRRVLFMPCGHLACLLALFNSCGEVRHL